MKSESRNNRQPHNPRFVSVAHSQDGSKHSIGITESGVAYSWGRTNELGQLGRKTVNSTATEIRSPNPIEQDRRGMTTTNGRTCTGTSQGTKMPRIVRAYAGGTSETGHSAILDSNGDLWMAGCDRWQQLGLGSPEGGATGYTWGDGGKIWRDVFVRNVHLPKLIKKGCSQDNLVGFPAGIRDVALGEDHTVVLSSNRRDVYTFGKGSEGQLGYIAKPFVSAPARSSVLSSRSGGLAAVCAIKHCSFSIDDKGDVVAKAGRCKMREMVNELKACITQADHDGLLDRNILPKQ